MTDKTTSRVVLGLLVTACLIATLFAWFRVKHEAADAVETQRSVYDDDRPRSAPLPVDCRLLLMTPQQLAKAPLADVFVAPLGDENGAFAYSAQNWGEMNKKRGGRHTGEDLNGIGGEDTDEGMPVRASGSGLLIYAGEPSPDWGNVVVLLHRLPDGRYIQSLYAHLKTVSGHPLGSLVGRGETIGTVGTAHGKYAAHLHFEMIESIAYEAGMPGYAATALNRLNPEEILKQYAPQPGDASPDPLIALKRVKQAAGWEKLMGNMLKDNSLDAVEKILPDGGEEGKNGEAAPSPRE